MAESSSAADRAFGPEPEEVEAIAEAIKAERDRSSIEQGRRIGGLPGAMVAGALIALRDIYESPKRDDGQVVVDRDGVQLAAQEIGGADDVAVPAQPRLDPIVSPRRRSRRRA